MIIQSACSVGPEIPRFAPTAVALWERGPTRHFVNVKSSSRILQKTHTKLCTIWRPQANSVALIGAVRGKIVYPRSNGEPSVRAVEGAARGQGKHSKHFSCCPKWEPTYSQASSQCLSTGNLLQRVAMRPHRHLPAGWHCECKAQLTRSQSFSIMERYRRVRQFVLLNSTRAGLQQSRRQCVACCPQVVEWMPGFKCILFLPTGAG